MIPYFSINEIKIAGLTLQIWGAFVSLGVLMALRISLKRTRAEKIHENLIWDMTIISLLGMIAGGRIFYLLTGPEKNLNVLDTHSGFSLMGGAIMAGVLSSIYLKKKKVDPREVYDLLVPGIITALIVARIGCFLVGDHIGKITNLPWGRAFVDGTIRHPIALYHIVFLTTIYFIMIKIEKKLPKKGQLLIVFCFLYAFFRFFADFFRCSDLDLCDRHFGSLTATQWVSLVFIISTVLYFLFTKFTKNHQKAKKVSSPE
ncbi:MAG: prolipoprotein diacylglyceryl transferase [Candidatus Pacebacteria bacterium]|nr:prolipoprotein diacylglyceryl transferase [Candidatus Paceibacterota bacterium]